MADYYIDHGAYASALGAVPTWGVPQEGDGSGLNAATASSIASLNINAVAVAGNTVVIAGVTLTAVASGATAAQFNVGATTAVQATNIATAINAATATVNVNASGAIPQLRNFVYARATGTLVEIMMRVGSATLNFANNSFVSVTSAGFSVAPTITQFAGGVGGCWGTLINNTARGVSNSYAIGLYGYAGMSRPIASASEDAPNVVALPKATDITYLRSKTGVTITLPANISFNFNSTIYHQHLVLDSNTKWTGDSGTGIFKVVMNCAATNPSILLADANGVFSKSIHSIVQYAFRFSLAAVSGAGTVNIRPDATAGVTFQTRITNVLFGEEGNLFVSGNTAQYTMSTGAGFTQAIFSNCCFDMSQTPRATFNSAGFMASTLTGSLTFDSCEFKFNFNTAADPNPIVASPVYGSGAVALKFLNCSFTGWTNGKFRAHGNLAWAATQTFDISFENCTGLVTGAYLGFSGTQVGSGNPSVGQYYFQSAEPDGAFRIENLRGVADWNPSASPAYPLLTSTQPDGSRWAMKMDWFIIPNAISRANPFVSPRLTQYYRDAEAIRTITLEMFYETALGIDTKNSAMRVNYLDSTGKLRSELTGFASNTLTASAANWTNAELYAGYSAFDYSITTRYAIKQNTEVSVTLELYAISPSGAIEQIYIDPQFSIA